MKVIKKLTKILIDILTALVFLILIIIIFAKVNMMATSRNYFEVFGYSIFNVATGSMEPAIKRNDVIIVKETRDFEVGDIITYINNDNNYITHRIVSIYDEQIVTKGDANNTVDASIKRENILGKVVKIYSNLGVWQNILSTPKIIIMIFATLIAFDFAFSYRGIVDKKNKKIVKKIKDVPLEKIIQKYDDAPKLSKKELEELYDKTTRIDLGESVKFDKKEKELLEYTIRLDLGELQKNISKKINKE